MENYSEISNVELEKSKLIISKITDSYYKKMVGQTRLGWSLLIAIISNGHILLESVPGLAKTTAAKTLTDAVNGKFSRIQCTPDLLPSDIIGTQIFNYTTNTFETKLGPVYANFVLLDEINRSSAKTQSAMLEVMQEHQTTIGGYNYAMPKIFTVIATQNPIEQEGTYPLSEAQTDRFLIKEVITYPTAAEEVEILSRMETGAISRVDPPVLAIGDIDRVQDIVDKVYVDNAIKWYISSIVVASRRAGQIQGLELGRYVRIGASPRASIAFLKMAKATALIQGRTYVTPEDVKQVSHQVLRHRIGLNYSAVADNVPVEAVIDALVNSVKAP